MGFPQRSQPGMIYTSYEMIQDFQAGRPAGVSYFISNYVPVIRKIAAHYAPGQEALVEKVLRTVRDSDLFRVAEPAPERWFLARLRQHVVALIEGPAPELPLDLETVAKALELSSIFQPLMLTAEVPVLVTSNQSVA